MTPRDGFQTAMKGFSTMWEIRITQFCGGSATYQSEEEPTYEYYGRQILFVDAKTKRQKIFANVGYEVTGPDEE